MIDYLKKEWAVAAAFTKPDLVYHEGLQGIYDIGRLESIELL